MKLFAVVLMLVSVNAFAGPVLIKDGDGNLLGANGVLVEGVSYDVQFLNGTCVDLFEGCDDLSDFTFGGPASATAASQALADTVFIDSALGLFDSSPNLTSGCALTTHCEVRTVFSTQGGQNGAIYFFNAAIEGNEFFSGPVNYPVGQSTSALHQATYAVWDVSATGVPAPQGALLLVLGALGVLRRRRG